MVSSSRKAFILVGDIRGRGASRYLYAHPLHDLPNHSEDAQEMSRKNIFVHIYVYIYIYVLNDRSSL